MRRAEGLAREVITAKKIVLNTVSVNAQKFEAASLLSRLISDLTYRIIQNLTGHRSWISNNHVLSWSLLPGVPTWGAPAIKKLDDQKTWAEGIENISPHTWCWKLLRALLFHVRYLGTRRLRAFWASERLNFCYSWLWRRCQYASSCLNSDLTLGVFI